jgi:prepilin-type N-terminal cleavage/methylation domain-containing protein
MNALTPRGRRQGFTLLELLAVISILGVLMGVGIGVFSQVNVSKFSAVGTVRSVLRTARENALATGLPVSVVCDGPANRVYDLSMRPFGNWCFEDEAGTGTAGSSNAASTGAFGLDAKLFGARVSAPGRPGASLCCANARDHATADLGARGEWIFRDGLSAELDVNVEKPLLATVLRRGRQFQLRLLVNGVVEGEVGLAENELPDAKTAGQLVVASRAGAVSPARWTRLGLVYDRNVLTLLVDGVVVGTREAREPVTQESAPLEFGDRQQTFAGRIDSVKLGYAAAGEGQKLPKQVSFALAGARQVIHFAGDGRLDPAWHRSETAIFLRFPENVRKDVRIGAYGIVR